MYQMKHKHVPPPNLRADLEKWGERMQQTEKSANSFTSFRSDIVMETRDTFA